MLEGVTIAELRTLRAVSEAGSFSAAARKLGRVQAAVSQSIDRLEAQLGLRLFDRSGRVPRLTRAGEAIVFAAARIEQDFEALDEVVSSLKRGEETRLSIVVDVMFPTSSLATFAKELAKTHPTVELVLFTEILSSVTSHVRSKRSSWGIALEDADMTGLERRPIAEVRLVPVCASTHPLAQEKEPIGSSGLAQAVQIVLGEHRDEADAGGDHHGVLSPRTWRVVDLATKLALIQNGLGWGHMPEHLVRDDLLAKRLVELDLEAWGDTPPHRALMVVWRRGVVMGPVAKWAIERLGDLCRSVVDPRKKGRSTRLSKVNHHMK